MSLLADQDYFIHALRLSYLRHVLPAHAPHASSIPGTGSYNLIAFDPTTLQTSPYIVASRTHDHALWPELSNGRSSPPLASTLARSAAASAVQSPESSEVGMGNDSRRRGATGLNYKETIYGKSGAGTGPGMRVGGRQRSTRGRRATTQVAPMEPVDKWDDSVDMVDTVGAHSLRRSRSLEASLHRRRLEENTLHNPTHPQQQASPPPVVIHSPVATPYGSRTNRHSGSSLSGQILVPAHLDQVYSSQLSHIAPASPESVRIASPPGVEADLPSSIRVTRFAIDELADSGGDLQQVDAPHLQSTRETALVPSSEDAGSESVGELSLSSTGPRNASVASSGVSLFGTSRLGSNDGILGPRDRSDSDSSFPSPAPPETPAMHDFNKADTFSQVIPPISPPPPRSPYPSSPDAPAPVPLSPTPGAETPAPAPPPQFVISARFMKAPRERRRVNISGRVFVPMAEPVHEEDPPTAASVAPVIAVPESVEKPKPPVLEIPESTSPADTRKEDSLNVSPTIVQRRGSGPPSLKIDTALASKPASAASSPIIAATEANPRLSPSANRRAHPIRQPSTGLTFGKRPLPSQLSSSTTAASAPPARSNLTALLGATSGSGSGSNPFSRLYAALISRASDALKLLLYFPDSDKPSTPLKIGVKQDLTVEEVIGAGLWAYWEEGREPKLEVEEEGEEEETIRWNLRIVEEDGEVDDDFPALDRTRAVSKFSFGEFAIVKATGNQVNDNLAKQATITRRPSPKMAAPKGPTNMLTLQQGHQVVPMSPLSGPQLSATAGVSSTLAIGVLLRIRLPAAPGQGVESINTTINVPGDMYMNDVLEHVCKKRNLENAREWAFTVRHRGSEIIVPLDRMVESLGDNHELKLVRRTEIGGLRGAGQINTPLVGEMNPSGEYFEVAFGCLSEDCLLIPLWAPFAASLFRRPGQDAYQSASELAATYRRYSVMRKLGVLGRHPRIIAIDGDYIHFLPSDSRGDVFSAGRTTSFHISMLRACQTSRRSNLAFKIVVQKDRLEKRYDFEAESVKQAHEIVQNVRTLMNSYKMEEATRQQQLQGALMGVVGTQVRLGTSSVGATRS
ncbi:BQ5605_C005g03581 [Microbotryum silenes-dioicae]|uniref:BQ5605_C005g03581 protein n=1 Tax=Microbotryum silenes-dioicae TaxID=796604 RepID=A0A2X0MEF1_9BASI|nr:BQ5605_C005g03581 [Microbotryum silenes-dioicae]